MTWQRAIGSLGAVAAAGFVVLTLQRNLRLLPPVEWSLALVAVCVAGIVVNLVAAALASFAWCEILAGAVARPSLARAFAICGRAQIGKYLPGNVFHFAGRIALASNAGIPVATTSASLAVETLVVVGVAGAVGAPVGLALPSQLVTSLPAPVLTAIAIGVAVAVFVVAWLIAPARLVDTIAIARRLASWPTIAIVALCDVVTFAALGGWLYAILLVAFPSAAASVGMWRCISAFAFAWVLGFVTPGAPGGIGVREVVFLAILGGPAGAGVAASLAIASRLQSVAGDIVTFALATAVNSAITARRASSVDPGPPSA